MNSQKKTLPLPVDYVYRGFALNPQAIAATDDRETINYQELKIRSEALAMVLQELAPEPSRIALCAQNHIDHLVSFLAILLAGHCWVPINPKNGAQLNQQLLKKSKPRLVLVDPESEVALAGSEITRIYLRSTSDNSIAILNHKFIGKAFTPVRAKADDIFGIKFTGGTTGEPKGVMQSHANVAAVVENMQALFEFQNSDGNLAVAPLTHGGSHYILPLLAVGGKQILLPQANTDLIREAFRERGASVSFMPPTLIYKIMDCGNDAKVDFNTLRHLTYSAAPMPPERIQQAIQFFGPKLSTVYGQTEAPMTITAMTAEDMVHSDLQGSVGKACLYSDIAIINGDGEQLTVGKSGEIIARGEIIMAGYFEEPEKTCETIREGWLYTGDLGYIDQNGYLFLQGRAKELIISGGFNVYPAEVENVLSEIPGVRESAVFSVDDEYWGERVEAAICLDQAFDLSDEDLSQKLRAELGAVKTPKAFHRLEQLPRNPVGKVVKREVKALIYPGS
ncbi:class I adenylate-forming enzyme family protein [Pseudoteredinibacter isoporae]|uniref:Acyl-CoA synthetase (AMP-forming)/AMP-acid ligase II n=1 Tax=Pseudoteredinibacter isoporae TaxID=570281 RepID=A0A7X0JQQ3_9GAMM|nr:AMP-binding protein [Pseudoteredinibacter isoporae]MBB6520543.1 acyl-CoA synthetase (AMP-forming)/AMP-acid ligase II [Pseudoteredinibacter isoporae]NHO86110.1 long-chain fatty acid--CoA ligase [Pseudoteredinibacter isoporae]NIB25439.1 long-chain fatty acid--CoA ligase [Pseudoteredinibacter isoporae]